jgi:hypothetical protein
MHTRLAFPNSVALAYCRALAHVCTLLCPHTLPTHALAHTYTLSLPLLTAGCNRLCCRSCQQLEVDSSDQCPGVRQSVIAPLLEAPCSAFVMLYPCATTQEPSALQDPMISAELCSQLHDTAQVFYMLLRGRYLYFHLLTRETTTSRRHNRRWTHTDDEQAKGKRPEQDLEENEDPSPALPVAMDNASLLLGWRDAFQRAVAAGAPSEPQLSMPVGPRVVIIGCVWCVCV